jgi:hypothetical protein
VSLASGSRLGGAFAAGVFAAVAAVRLRRRRAYRPQPPQPGPLLAAPPPPAGLADLLRATRTTTGDDDISMGTLGAKPLEPLTALPDADARLRPDVLLERSLRSDNEPPATASRWIELLLTPEVNNTYPSSVTTMVVW